MLDRPATLTWRRPKLVLRSAVFVVVAGAFGRDVERHLKAAGFSDGASQSERATELLREELGHVVNPLRDRRAGAALIARRRVARR